MNTLNPQTILAILATVIDREQQRDVVSLGMVSGLVVRSGKIGFILTVEATQATQKAYLQLACEEALKKIPGVETVTVVLTAEKPATPNAPSRTAANWNREPLPHVKRIIAIASGKGGVGKSTTTVNLALALIAKGLQVGILDADIYGPSLPHILKLSAPPAFENGQMIPPEKHGIKAMSLGLITGDEAAILRGPMIGKTLQQLLRLTRWGSADAPLDLLLIDMPPGTGDVPLSLAQNVPLDGAIIVTTPQELAIIDARKCLIMFSKLGVNVLGVIENMSYLTGPNGKRLALFGEGGGARLAEAFNIPYLGAIAIDPAIGLAAEAGTAYRSNEYDHLAESLR